VLGVRRMFGCALCLMLLGFAQLMPAQTGGGAGRLSPCRAQPTLVGRCFSVRGRLSLYNGAPTIRLWRAGTRRMLGVSASYGREGYSSIPEELERRLSWETELWGDFLVCPFTRRKPGEMQMICVESAKNVFARERR
jgi:hypothetical protein